MGSEIVDMDIYSSTFVKVSSSVSPASSCTLEKVMLSSSSIFLKSVILEAKAQFSWTNFPLKEAKKTLDQQVYLA